MAADQFGSTMTNAIKLAQARRTQTTVGKPLLGSLQKLLQSRQVRAMPGYRPTFNRAGLSPLVSAASSLARQLSSKKPTRGPGSGRPYSMI